jgi:hypothetical protein
MIGHNSEGWRTMPVAFEEYVQHFSAAQAAWTMLYRALDHLMASVTQARQSPQILAGPNNQPWPDQEALKKMFFDAQAKTSPLMNEYNQLPSDTKQYAPNPQTAGQKR